MLEDFLKRFEYELGPVFVDGWRVVVRRGDCDDFALTVAKELSGSWIKLLINIVILRVVFWRVHSPSNKIVPRHVALYYRGRGWIDSTYPTEFRSSISPHKRRYPILAPWVVMMALLGIIYGVYDNGE